MKGTYIKEFEEWSAGFLFAAPLTVRFSDIDAYGIVNNAVVISYFEYARIEYLKHLGLMKDWLNPSTENMPVIADIQCDYVKPIVYDEKLQIYVKIETVGRSSMDLHYLGKNENDEVVFTGRSTMVQVGKNTGKGVSWTDEERALFLS